MDPADKADREWRRRNVKPVLMGEAPAAAELRRTSEMSLWLRAVEALESIACSLEEIAKGSEDEGESAANEHPVPRTRGNLRPSNAAQIRKRNINENRSRKARRSNGDD